MVWGEIKLRQKVGAQYTLTYVGDCKFKCERAVSDTNRFCTTTETIYSSSIRRAEAKAVRSSAALQIRRGDDGE